MLDERSPDELLDDWMISSPAAEPTSSDWTYFFDRFFGTLAPFLRASESPIAIACFLLLTFLPDLPLFSVPGLRFFMARPTFFDAPLEYLLFFCFLGHCTGPSKFLEHPNRKRSAKGSFSLMKCREHSRSWDDY